MAQGKPTLSTQSVTPAYQQPVAAPQPIQTGPTAWQAQTPGYGSAGVQPARFLYGGFWRRFMAYIIDLLLLFVLFFLIGIVLHVMIPNFDGEKVEGLFNLLGILTFWVYYANMESGPHQGTLGKRALGLRVCGENGLPIGFGCASGRFFGKIISGLVLGIGFLMIGFTKQKQGLHDKMAGALVVRTGE